MTLAPRLQAPSCLALVSGPLVIPHAQQVMCIIASSSPGNHCDFTKTGQCLSSRTPGPCPPPPAPHSIWRLWPRAGDKNLPASRPLPTCSSIQNPLYESGDSDGTLGSSPGQSTTYPSLLQMAPFPGQPHAVVGVVMTLPLPC